jgi:hypothetical protein
MNSFEKALIAESDECIDCEDYKLGYLAGLRKAAEIIRREQYLDPSANVEAIESEASLIEGSTGEKT